MKKLLLVILAGLLIGACAQKTCPTYASNSLEVHTELTIASV
ncbi:MAG: hypothetical protein ACJAT1_002103 [Marivirga sp.]|jgi:hypothetical protein